MTNNNKQNLFAVFGLLFGAVCWGIIWYPYRLIDQAGISGVSASFYTYCIALAIGIGVFWKNKSDFKNLPIRALFLTVVAGWTNLSYVLAVIDGEVMRVMLLFYLSPLWTLILAHFWLKEKIHRNGYIAIMIAMLGAFIMLNDFSRPSWPLPRNHAEWLALSAGVGFSLTNVITRKSSDLSLGVKSILVWVGVATMSLLTAPWLAGQFPLPSSLLFTHWIIMAMIAVILVSATIFVQYGVTQMTATRASVLFLFELVVAAIASYYLAHEAMAWSEWVGGLLIIAAGFIAAIQTIHD